MYKKILLVLFIFCINFMGYSQSFLINDFYVQENGNKIYLGDSLKEIDLNCDLKLDKCKQMGNGKYNVYKYKWGYIYTSYKDYMIFGIEINNSDVEIKNGIKIGLSKTVVEDLLKQPDYTVGNSYYYYNDDYDVLEIKITFNKNDIVNKIELFMGT